MNKMCEVAHLLGLELGQFFMIDMFEGVFCITEHGLVNVILKGNVINNEQGEILQRLLLGDFEITHVAKWTKIKEGYHG